MATENLEAAAAEPDYDIKIETHGSIGVEGHLTPEDIKNADAIVIGAERSKLMPKPVVRKNLPILASAPQLRKAWSSRRIPRG